MAARPDNPSAQDPLDPNGMQPGGIAVRRGAFAVTLGYWMSSGGWDMGRDTFTFRFENGHFGLIGYDAINVNRGSGQIDETSIDVITGRMKTTTSHADSDRSAVHWKTLPQKPQRTIDQIGEGLGFDPKS